jgi:hypothetical protein
MVAFINLIVIGATQAFYLTLEAPPVVLVITL